MKAFHLVSIYHISELDCLVKITFVPHVHHNFNEYHGMKNSDPLVFDFEIP